MTAAHAIYCKFLVARESYIACHIRVPDVPQRIPAIALDGRFYSFFRAVPEAAKALAIATRLGKRDDEIAITLNRRGYSIWVNETQANYAPPASDPRHSLKPAFGPASCLILGDPMSFSRCTLTVPDLAQSVDGLSYSGRFYSIFRQTSDAAEAIAIAAKLAQKGDETLMTINPEGIVIAVREINAAIAASVVG
ncbi:MAG TPA: hypothetical protein V6D06_08765 [Trichocoleus sp.]